MGDKKVKLALFDHYNRTQTHNEKVLKYIKTHRPNYVVCSNVLNVIEEKDIIQEIIKNITILAGKDNFTTCIFAIYEGDKTNIGKVTPKGYQRNEKTSAYVKYIRKYFPIVKKVGNFIIASNF
jgi:hypothetical protein